MKHDRKLRAVHPRDILDQLLDIARYLNRPPQLNKDLIDRACEKLGKRARGARFCGRECPPPEPAGDGGRDLDSFRRRFSHRREHRSLRDRR